MNLPRKGLRSEENVFKSVDFTPLFGDLVRQVEHVFYLTDKVLDFSGRAKPVIGMAGLTDYLSKKTRFITTQEVQWYFVLETLY